ncbi:uncharacterized protein LOC121947200 [Plectropomus leopardus]|uniref:uncharacterized protein LOC121947200 n=1 Tax=Plectropomus leopardus TaxID=160734 RepID=UPI001C4A7F62|nr:uncharacterized protein LOC121947200 [Plectropomus leopardus]
MESLRTALAHFAGYISKTAGVYTTIIVIFSYHIVLQKDLVCTCQDQHVACWVYMFVPAAILFLLMLWMDKTFQRVWEYIRTTSNTRFCCDFWYHVVQAFALGLLWVISVLIDGDWYVCCWNDGSVQQAKLGCMDTTEIKREHQVIINKLKNDSRVTGLFLLLAVTLLASCMSSVLSKACCGTGYIKKSNGCKTGKIILEEFENLETKTLREAINNKVKGGLNERVNNETWVTDPEELFRELFPHLQLHRQQPNEDAAHKQPNEDAAHEQPNEAAAHEQPNKAAAHEQLNEAASSKQPIESMSLLDLKHHRIMKKESHDKIHCDKM